MNIKINNYNKEETGKPFQFSLLPFHFSLLSFAFSLLTFFVFLFSSHVIAQNKKDLTNDRPRHHKTEAAAAPNSTQATGDTVSVKDDAGNVLMTVTDEGSAGSIKLNDAGAVSQNTNKLYNNGGNLYWNGSALSTGSGGGWTDAGSSVYLSTSTAKVGIGTTTPQSRLSVGGDGNSYASVYGESEVFTGYGVYGKATGNFSTGVYGVGTSKGVYGKATDSSGIGVYGSAGSSGYGVYGYANDQTGFAGYFNGKGYFSGKVGIGTTSSYRKFYVQGDAGGLEPWHNDSDRRLKKNIKTISNALDKVNKLRGVNFNWKNTEDRIKGLQMGFIAQEAKEVIPEVVEKKGKYYSMQYAPITALLVEAVKIQDKRIKTLEEENKKLVSVINENKTFRNEMNIMKATLNKILKERTQVKVSRK